jgi:hypothetical protein
VRLRCSSKHRQSRSVWVSPSLGKKKRTIPNHLSSFCTKRGYRRLREVYAHNMGGDLDDTFTSLLQPNGPGRHKLLPINHLRTLVCLTDASWNPDSQGFAQAWRRPGRRCNHRIPLGIQAPERVVSPGSTPGILREDLGTGE